MKTRLLGAVCACLSIASLSTGVNATIVDNGSYTTDTSSGLDWLDLTATAGMSYNEVNAQLGSGGPLQGWSYASRAQVEGLWTAFGGDPGYYNGWSAENNGLFDVIAPLVGDLWCNAWDCNPGEGYSYWITADAQFDTKRWVAFSYDRSIDINAPTRDLFHTGQAIDVSDSSALYGSALYRVSAVPLPAAVWLFGTGLLGFIGVARRKVRV